MHDATNAADEGAERRSQSGPGSIDVATAAAFFKGKFIAVPELIAEKLQTIKAFIFDWDGVFNAGWKDAEGSSAFNEVDAMGTNLLRFNHYLGNGTPPVSVIISGETNKAALRFAEREHFHALYSGIKYKAQALDHLCAEHDIRPEEVCFMFDDVLDFSVAEIAGLRIMVGRDCNPLMIDWAISCGMVDYLTAATGADYAVREAVELLTGISGRYEETIAERARFTPVYKTYLAARNEATTQRYELRNGKIATVK